MVETGYLTNEQGEDWRNNLPAKSKAQLWDPNICRFWLEKQNCHVGHVSLLTPYTFLPCLLLSMRRIKAIVSLIKYEKLTKYFNHAKMKRPTRQWMSLSKADIQFLTKEKRSSGGEESESSYQPIPSLLQLLPAPPSACLRNICLRPRLSPQLQADAGNSSAH